MGIKSDDGSGNKGHVKENVDPTVKLQRKNLVYNYSSEDTDSTDSRSDISTTSESAIKAAWDKQFCSLKRFYCPDSFDELDLCQQLINKYHKLMVAQDIVNEDEMQESRDGVATVTSACTNECGNGSVTSYPSEIVSDAFSSNESLTDRKNKLPSAKFKSLVVQDEQQHHPTPIPTSAQADSYLKNEASNSFKKRPPLDPAETWDFSLQALDGTYKSQHILKDSKLFKTFTETCRHDMYNVRCDCEEKKKIGVCRLCHTVFCSKACFQKVNKIQVGQELDAHTTEKIEQVNSEKQTVNSSSKSNEECGQTVQDKKQAYKDQDVEKQLISKQNNQRNTRNVTNREGDGGLARNTIQNQNSYSGANTSHPVPGIQLNTEPTCAGPTLKFSTPTQVLINRVICNSTKLNATAKVLSSPHNEKTDPKGQIIIF